MKRKDFLRGLGLVGIGSFAIPIINACSKDDDSSETSTDTDTATDTGSDSGSSGNCSVTSSETAGPFPTITPSS